MYIKFKIWLLIAIFPIVRTLPASHAYILVYYTSRGDVRRTEGSIKYYFKVTTADLLQYYVTGCNNWFPQPTTTFFTPAAKLKTNFQNMNILYIFTRLLTKYKDYLSIILGLSLQRNCQPKNLLLAQD